ncbi:MAG: flagellar biosynthetic protein FliQ [Acetobacteraceae bacterium]|nr:flagellar biosynthetic protein FliQ [Acetobacteraceae bacterium]
MNDPDIAGLIRDGVIVLLRIGGPPLAAMLAVGIVVALLQAVTQINESTLVFVPKVLVLGVVLLLLWHSMYGALSTYALLLFDRIAAAGTS